MSSTAMMGNNIVSDAACQGLSAPSDQVSTDALLGPLVKDGATLIHALLEMPPPAPLRR